MTEASKVKREPTSGVSGRDREFLPAALEILETPPPPRLAALTLTICLACAAALVWSFFGRLDVHAVAPGKIERFGRAKVIESLDPGRIAAIHVAAGDRVKAGDLLFELDPAEAKADADIEADAEQSSRAEMARRRAAIDFARTLQARLRVDDGDAGAARRSFEAIAADPLAHVAWEASTPPSYRRREAAVLSGDLNHVSDALDTLERKRAEKQATLQRLKMSIVFEETLLGTLLESVKVHQRSFDQAGGAKITLLEAKGALERSQATLASDQGQLIETDAGLKELAGEEIRTLSEFIADNENRLEDAARKLDEARGRLAKAEARLARTRLVAPIDGVVQQFAVTTIGQVVTTGQELATVVADDGQLLIEALVTNLDIGFIRLGQEATIKVDAFPFTRYGALHGKVIRVAAEAVEEQTAKRSLSDATAANSPLSGAGTSAPGQAPSFVFPVTISLEASSMKIDGVSVGLTPGMTVTAEIKTESRRVIDYLLSPLARVGSEAMRER